VTSRPATPNHSVFPDGDFYEMFEDDAKLAARELG